MIGRLVGHVVAAEEVDAVVLDVGGVGYELTVPLGTVGRATTDGEGRTTLFVHTHAREDALVLFGFATESDRVAFRTLIGVSSVGPKTAIAVLSVLPGPELARAISAKDVGKLTSVPGIGKKTAERLLLELRDKIAVTGAMAAPSPASRTGTAPAAPPTSGNGELLVSALTRMGYRPSEAERAVTTLGARVSDMPLADAVREALAFLAK
jgi:Holliday junction DNA helicase RuvA